MLSIVASGEVTYESDIRWRATAGLRDSNEWPYLLSSGVGMEGGRRAMLSPNFSYQSASAPPMAHQTRIIVLNSGIM